MKNDPMKRANELVAQFCQTMGQEFGIGKDYNLALAAASSTLLFHAFRMALQTSYPHAVEVTKGILNDVSVNLKENGGIRVNFKVEEE